MCGRVHRALELARTFESRALFRPIADFDGGDALETFFVAAFGIVWKECESRLARFPSSRARAARRPRGSTCPDCMYLYASKVALRDRGHGCTRDP